MVLKEILKILDENYDFDDLSVPINYLPEHISQF